MNLLLGDLNSALDHGLTTEDMLRAPGHTPYKDFADTYCLHRRGNSAVEAVTFHALRLRGIRNLKSLFGQFNELLGGSKAPTLGGRTPMVHLVI